MKNIKAFERMQVLCEILSSNKNIYRLNDVLEKLSERDIVIERSTLQVDLKTIRAKDNEVMLKNAGKGNIPLNFQKPFSFELHNVISESDKAALEIVRDLIQPYIKIDNLVSALNKVLARTNVNHKSYIFSDTNFIDDNVKNFLVIHNAIVQKKVIRIALESNNEVPSLSFELKPYYLKESFKQWYCIGELTNQKKLKTICLDNIYSIKPTDLTYRLNPVEIGDMPDYTHYFGIHKPEGAAKPTTIKLAFDRKTGEMLELHPFHPTQKVIARNNNEIVMEYQIFYKPNSENRELLYELCKYIGRFKIIEPSIFNNEIRNIIENCKIIS